MPTVKTLKSAFSRFRATKTGKVLGFDRRKNTKPFKRRIKKKERRKEPFIADFTRTVLNSPPSDKELFLHSGFVDRGGQGRRRVKGKTVSSEQLGETKSHRVVDKATRELKDYMRTTFLVKTDRRRTDVRRDRRQPKSAKK